MEIADQGLIGTLCCAGLSNWPTNADPAHPGQPRLADMVVFCLRHHPGPVAGGPEDAAERLKALVEAQIIDVNEARDGLGYEAVLHGGDGLRMSPRVTTQLNRDPSAQTTASGRHPDRQAPPAIHHLFQGAISVRGDALGLAT